MLNAGIVAVAVELPSRTITNAYLRETYPDVCREQEAHALAKLWRPHPDEHNSKLFDDASAVYLNDPFKGCVERHWLEASDGAVDLEERAARRALAAAHMSPADVDLCICCSFFPDQCDVGNGAFLAKRLGMSAPAWNFESACAGSASAMQQAIALVAGGLYRRVLVVVSCTYSRVSPEGDTLAWMNGDGAAAFVVASQAQACGLIAVDGRNTHETCGSIWSTFETDSNGKPAIRLHTGPNAGKLLRQGAETTMRTCVDGALRKADRAISDIDFFLVNTPVAWFSAFAQATLGFPAHKTANVHPRVANVGPVLMPANLELALTDGRLQKGMQVLCYAFGSVASATASVLVWGDTSVG